MNRIDQIIFKIVTEQFYSLRSNTKDEDNWQYPRTGTIMKRIDRIWCAKAESQVTEADSMNADWNIFMKKYESKQRSYQKLTSGHHACCYFVLFTRWKLTHLYRFQPKPVITNYHQFLCVGTGSNRYRRLSLCTSFQNNCLQPRQLAIWFQLLPI